MHGEVKFKVSKKKLGSYPSVSVVLSITLALFAIGVFGAVVIYSKELEKAVKENIRIQVYLNSRVTKEERSKIERALSVKYFVPKNEKGVIQFVSKEEAEK